jgi:hypothetical protein
VRKGAEGDSQGLDDADGDAGQLGTGESLGCVLNESLGLGAIGAGVLGDTVGAIEGLGESLALADGVGAGSTTSAKGSR